MKVSHGVCRTPRRFGRTPDGRAIHGSMHRAGALNLVSLMDIFTILVFFLMVNSSDVKVMQQSTDVSLPLSASEKPNRETLLVEVSGDSVRVQGREVARLQGSPSGGPTHHLQGLMDELNYRKAKHPAIPEDGWEITVVADKGIRYRDLRRVMQACVDADYRRVRLAVEHRSDGTGEGANG